MTTTSPAQSTEPSSVAGDVFEGFANGALATVSTMIESNPVAAAVIGGFLLLCVVLKVRSSFSTVAKDPSRLFSSVQRTEGFARAGGQCELEGWMFTRCKRKASHGDHHFPWSRGGATSMANFVAACAKCNTSKGAKVPSPWATARMETRRRRYFSEGLTVKAGERFLQR